MESAVTLSPSAYPFSDHGISYCWTGTGNAGLSYPFACTDGLYEQQQRALSSCYPQPVGSPQIFSVSSPASSSTELGDIQDIFQGGESSFSASLQSHKPRSPQAAGSAEKRASCGKATRVKRVHAGSSSSKPYRRTASPVFPDGAVPISSLMACNNQQTQPQLPPLNTSTSFIHSKCPVTVKVHSPRLTEQFKDIEKKLLHLYSEKSKLLHQLMKQDSGSCNFESKTTDTGDLVLSILPTGQSEFDNGFIEEVNSLLLTIGGLSSSFQSSLNKLLTSSQSSSIADCIANHLMGSSDQLLLAEDLYTKLIHVDQASCTLSPGLKHIVDCLNGLLETSQSITNQSQYIQSLLASYLKKISSYKEGLESKGCSCKETKTIAQSILMGNTVVLNSVQKLWEQDCIKATDIISSISNALTIHHSTYTE